MTQKVIQIGTSAGITIPKRSLEGLGMSIGDRVDVQILSEKQTLMVRPIGHLDAHEKRVLKVGMDIIERYRKDFEALAKK